MDVRTVVMHRGRVEQVGTAAELKKNPCNFFVAQFMNGSAFGSSEVEIVKGKTAVEAMGNGFSIDVPGEWVERLERGGYLGRRVLLGYTTCRSIEEEEAEETRPEAGCDFFFFDQETREAIH